MIFLTCNIIEFIAVKWFRCVDASCNMVPSRYCMAALCSFCAFRGNMIAKKLRRCCTLLMVRSISEVVVLWAGSYPQVCLYEGKPYFNIPSVWVRMGVFPLSRALRAGSLMRFRGLFRLPCVLRGLNRHRRSVCR